MQKRFFAILLIVMCFSCASKKEILYMQDINQLNNSEINFTNATIQPNDVLRITVSSLNPTSAIPYNQSQSTQQAANPQILQIQGYLVSEDNQINFPILGKISTVNKTTFQLADHIKNILEEDDHLKNPNVSVRLVNAKVTILGEVNNAGTYTFTEQNITLLQALGYAGDLTINGKREDIVVVRFEEGVRKVAHIDLTTSEWMTGEYGFIQPNDVIYVMPNAPRVKSAGFVGNVGTAISVVSILLTTVVLITR